MSLSKEMCVLWRFAFAANENPGIQGKKRRFVRSKSTPKLTWKREDSCARNASKREEAWVKKRGVTGLEKRSDVGRKKGCNLGEKRGVTCAKKGCNLGEKSD